MPMELSMPPVVSDTRGVGLPARVLGDTLFMTSAPRLLKSRASAYSIAKHPEAGMTGLRRDRSPTLTLRLAKFHLPHDIADGKYGPFTAYPQKLLVTPGGIKQTPRSE